MAACDHCGADPALNPGGLWVQQPAHHSEREYTLCHPDDPGEPDCYRRVTVYHEPVGALRGQPRPGGVDGLTSARHLLDEMGRHIAELRLILDNSWPKR